MKRVLLFAFSMMASMICYSQKITFYSPEFEEGVKAHIGLGQNEEVLQNHTDTITAIDLSGLGMTDIRDVIYLTNVEKLNLASNNITDISSLTSLESLEKLDLSWNLLEDISELAFACSDNMQVNVAYNFIKDFGFVLSSPSHHFNMIGLGAQRVKDAPIFKVYQLMAGYGEDNAPIVYYRGRTNAGVSATISFRDSQLKANMDDETHTVAVPENLAETTSVTLTNGEQSVTTYVVPSAEYTVGAGKTVTLETGLPEDYRLYSAYASMGTVEIDGTKMNYTAPGTMAADVIYFSYYQGATLKGFSRCYVNKVVGDLTGDAKVDDEDFTFVANCIMGKLTSETDKKKADINGDGEVNAADLVALANLKKYGKITPPNGTRKAETDVIGI